MIAAVSVNGVIGVNNTLPWHLPDDLRHFKSTTMGKPIVMGRVTFESIGRPLPGRTNIVVSSRSNWAAPGIEIYRSFESAIEGAEKAAAQSDVDEIMIIGGEQLYRQAMPLAQRLYLTRVEDAVHGDAHFPDVDSQLWVEKSLVKVAAKDGLPAYRYVVLDRKSSGL